MACFSLRHQKGFERGKVTACHIKALAFIMFPPNTVAEKTSCLCCLLHTTTSPPPFLLAPFLQPLKPSIRRLQVQSLPPRNPTPSPPSRLPPCQSCVYGVRNQKSTTLPSFPASSSTEKCPGIPNWVVKGRGKRRRRRKNNSWITKRKGGGGTSNILITFPPPLG